MKKIIALVAVAAIAIVAGPEASAQSSFSFNNGFNFGAGATAGGLNRGNQGFGFGGGFFRGGSRQVRPPYFAEFPPVYYNGIVRRPYGISPFAAPAGVTPIELHHPVVDSQPLSVSNPYFKQGNNKPISVMESVDQDPASTKNKSTKIANPHFNGVPEFSGNTMHASFETFDN